MIFPNYRPGATAEIVKVSAFQALSRIAGGCCVINPPANAETVKRLASWAGSFPSYEVTYSSLPEATTAIRERLGS
jgi:hypothetical protein